MIKDTAADCITFPKGSCRNELFKGRILVFFDLIIKIVERIVKMISQQPVGYRLATFDTPNKRIFIFAASKNVVYK